MYHSIFRSHPYPALSPFDSARVEAPLVVSNSPAYTSEYLNQLKAANAAPLLNIVADDVDLSADVYTADDLAAMGIDDSIEGESPFTVMSNAL